jgi:hypothetical protein
MTIWEGNQINDTAVQVQRKIINARFRIVMSFNPLLIFFQNKSIGSRVLDIEPASVNEPGHRIPPRGADGSVLEFSS